MKLYRTSQGPVVEVAPGRHRLLKMDWHRLLASPELISEAKGEECGAPEPKNLLAPVGDQEVWASGVTYYRSRDARMQEAQEVGGGDGDFYAKVYNAERPELFFKSTAARVIAPNGFVRIRKDSKWNVPEPELTLFINKDGNIVGYTIANDMSSRDIEGENPLYLPQAKVYDGSCAMGPCIYFTQNPLPATTAIIMGIFRQGKLAFSGNTTISQIKRELTTLAEYLYRELSFPEGCFLLTGTGIVPDPPFTLQSGDEVVITIEPIGTLRNVVA